MSLRSAAFGVAACDAYRGVVEEGENSGTAVRGYLSNCDPPINVAAPWCAAAVQWWADVAAEALDVPNPLDEVRREAYVDDYYAWAMGREILIPPSQARSGDLVLFEFPTGPDRWNHIGFVARPPDNTWTIWTVEGNTSPGVGATDGERQREGDGVYLKQRHLDGSYRTAFVRWSP